VLDQDFVQYVIQNIDGNVLVQTTELWQNKQEKVFTQEKDIEANEH
jgi:hypothetical protein